MTHSYINYKLNLWKEISYNEYNRKNTEKIVYFINKSNTRIYKSLFNLLKCNKQLLNKSIKLYKIN